MRALVYQEIKPVQLKNCKFSRFGGKADGGYLLCENLLRDVQSVYSYGIAGEDNWGCDLAIKYNLPIRQYDCFDPRKPICSKQDLFFFQNECLGIKKQITEGRLYNTLANQIHDNQDENKKLLLKLDIEGDEWKSLLDTSEDILNAIDQIAIEFHEVNTNPITELLLIRKLKKYFHIVNIHFNNYSCQYDFYPLPASTFQALLVNKRLGVLESKISADTYHNPLDNPDNPKIPDCQVNWR